MTISGCVSDALCSFHRSDGDSEHVLSSSNYYCLVLDGILSCVSWTRVHFLGARLVSKSTAQHFDGFLMISFVRSTTCTVGLSISET